MHPTEIRALIAAAKRKTAITDAAYENVLDRVDHNQGAIYLQWDSANDRLGKLLTMKAPLVELVKVRTVALGCRSLLLVAGFAGWQRKPTTSDRIALRKLAKRRARAVRQLKILTKMEDTQRCIRQWYWAVNEILKEARRDWSDAATDVRKLERLLVETEMTIPDVLAQQEELIRRKLTAQEDWMILEKMQGELAVTLAKVKRAIKKLEMATEHPEGAEKTLRTLVKQRIEITRKVRTVREHLRAVRTEIAETNDKSTHVTKLLQKKEAEVARQATTKPSPVNSSSQ